MKKTLLLISTTIFWIGCIVLSPYQYRNYQINRIDSCVVGNPLILIQNGLISHDRTNLDTLRYFFGYESELLYTGISGNTIYLTHREYQTNASGVFIKPAFSLQVQYDLAISKLITFQHYSIEIFEATPYMLKYRVIDDHGNHSENVSSTLRSDSQQSDTMHLYYEPPKMTPMNDRQLVNVILQNGFTMQVYLSGESFSRYIFATSRTDTTYSTVPKEAVRSIEEVR